MSTSVKEYLLDARIGKEFKRVFDQWRVGQRQ